MNDEIKEILESLDKIAKAEYYPEDLLTYKECQLLLDYITNLQEENERLSVELNQNMIERNNYLSRNEKAIDFVKKESKKCYSNQTNDNSTKVIGNFMWHTDKLLNILNGGDDK